MAEKAVNCAICGKNLALVGRMHHCQPRVRFADVTLEDLLLYEVLEAERARAEAKSTALSTLSTPSPKPGAKRQAKWREANPEIHRERSRSSMRKLREKKAPDAPA